jgi:hypothetical protein
MRKNKVKRAEKLINMTNRYIVAYSIILVIVIYFIFLWIPFNNIKELSIKTNQQKQVVKNFLNKKIGFELPDEFDVNKVVIVNGKDKLIFVKGLLNNTELVQLQNNTEYQKTSCDKQEIALSIFKNPSAEKHIIIDKTYKFEKKGETTYIIVAPNIDLKTSTIYIHITDNKFPLSELHE